MGGRRRSWAFGTSAVWRSTAAAATLQQVTSARSLQSLGLSCAVWAHVVHGPCHAHTAEGLRSHVCQERAFGVDAQASCLSGEERQSLLPLDSEDRDSPEIS